MDAADVVAAREALGLIAWLKRRMTQDGGKGAFVKIQQELAPLLATVPPAQAVRLLLECLRQLLAPNTAVGDVDARGTSFSASLAHLLVELLPTCASELPAPELRSMAADAADLVESCCLVPGRVRLAVKLAQSFELSMEDFKDPSGLIDFVADMLTDRVTLSPAAALIMSLGGFDEQFDKASIIGDLVAGGLDSTAERWAGALGHEFQVLYVEQCIAQDRLKPASKAVRMFSLRSEFPDVESEYRTRSVGRLLAKRVWAVAAQQAGADAKLQELVVRAMVEAGERGMADEYRSLFGLPESALAPADPAVLAAEAAARAARYMQPPRPALFVDSPEQLAEVEVIMAAATLMGLDVEWKPSHIGSSSGGGSGSGGRSGADAAVAAAAADAVGIGGSDGDTFGGGGANAAAGGAVASGSESGGGGGSGGGSDANAAAGGAAVSRGGGRSGGGSGDERDGAPGGSGGEPSSMQGGAGGGRAQQQAQQQQPTGVACPASLLQVATDTHTLVFDLLSLGGNPRLDSALSAAFHNPRCLKVGFELAGDLSKLAASYPGVATFARVERVFDLRHLWAAHLAQQQQAVQAGRRAAGDGVVAAGGGVRPSARTAGLSTLSAALLGKPLDKSMQVSDWEQRPLSQRQLDYAGLDAAVLVLLYHSLASSLGETLMAATREAHTYTYVAGAARRAPRGGGGGGGGGGGNGGDGGGGGGGALPPPGRESDGGGDDSRGGGGGGVGGSSSGGGSAAGLAPGAHASGSSRECSGGGCGGGGGGSDSLAWAPPGAAACSGSGRGAADSGGGGGAASTLSTAAVAPPHQLQPRPHALPHAVPTIRSPTSAPTTSAPTTSGPLAAHQQPKPQRHHQPQPAARAAPVGVASSLRDLGLLATFTWLQWPPLPMHSQWRSAGAAPAVASVGGGGAGLGAGNCPSPRDLTTTLGAARALGVPAARMAKCVALLVARGGGGAGSAGSPLPLCAGAAPQQLSAAAAGPQPLAPLAPLLAVIRGDARIDMRRLAAAVGARKRDVRLATAAECVSLFGYEPGAVLALTAAQLVRVARGAAADITADASQGGEGGAGGTTGLCYTDGGATPAARAAPASAPHRPKLPRAPPGAVDACAAIVAASAGIDRPPRAVACEPRFLVDAMLGRLTRWLRCLGLDAEQVSADVPRHLLPSLALEAAANGRVLVTRDARLCDRLALAYAAPLPFLVCSTQPAEQLREVAFAFGVALDDDRRSRLMTRCPRCNAAQFRVAEREGVEGRMSARVYESVAEFFECGGCTQVFWMGPVSRSAIELMEGLLLEAH
ncbi:hypothetical protein FOA52_015462 [Chlamydomonas sp. UWO 241]|nr:hypothetical protein FOA52_015462 [Chlamydomonas sp. UWO 241]